MKQRKNRPSGQSGGRGNGPQGGGGGRFRRRIHPPSPPREKQAPLPPSALADTRAALESWLPPPPRPGSAPAIKPLSGDRDLGDLSILDPWQREALEALNSEESVIVDAPTTAGKTRIVEAYFHANLKTPGFRAAYTTPVKSLSNDKLREFRDLFGVENVGIATGDVKENLGAPIVVATLETYRNSLLGMEPDLGRRLVVFDEYHYLQDEGRGSAWEEAIMLTPPDCRLLLLSASVDNAEQFRDWLTAIRQRPCRIVRTTHRPVPLEPLVWYGNHWVIPKAVPALNQPLGGRPGQPPGRPAGRPGRPDGDDQRRPRPMPPEPDEIALRLAPIIGLRLTPCIVYAGRRLSCEVMAQAIARAIPPLHEPERVALENALREAEERFGSAPFIRRELRRMITQYGVGFHHSGLAPQARLTMESLVKRGLLRFCAATMGLSLGVNFAVRSAIMTDYSRPGEAGFTEYANSEVLQMLGRAGRRGQDRVGFSLWADAQMYRRFGRVRREACASRLRNDPATYLGLAARGMSLGDIERFYERSFRHWTRKSTDLKLIRPDALMASLKRHDLPCVSPAAEFTAFLQGEGRPTECSRCTLRHACHARLRDVGGGELASLQMHLHAIGALDRDGTLTPFGDLARYLPQFGGMLLARMMVDGRLNDRNPLAAAELMGALSLAAHKDPTDWNAPDAEKRDEPSLSNYLLPFREDDLLEELEELYPVELFPELYDTGRDRRRTQGLRDFNAAGGFIASEWGRATPWDNVLKRCTSRAFGAGDLMNLLLRVATYIHSVAQAAPEPMRSSLVALRREWLRDPLAMGTEPVPVTKSSQVSTP